MMGENELIWQRRTTVNEVVVEDGREVAVVDGWRRLGVLAVSE